MDFVVDEKQDLTFWEKVKDNPRNCIDHVYNYYEMIYNFRCFTNAKSCEMKTQCWLIGWHLLFSFSLSVGEREAIYYVVEHKSSDVIIKLTLICVTINLVIGLWTGQELFCFFSFIYIYRMVLRFSINLKNCLLFISGSVFSRWKKKIANQHLIFQNYIIHSASLPFLNNSLSMVIIILWWSYLLISVPILVKPYNICVDKPIILGLFFASKVGGGWLIHESKTFSKFDILK